LLIINPFSTVKFAALHIVSERAKQDDYTSVIKRLFVIVDKLSDENIQVKGLISNLKEWCGLA